MGSPVLRRSIRDLLLEGTVIPAHPLALDSKRGLDTSHQRALTRYYVAAGAGGIAVGVHTTQFSVREKGLLEPVLRLAAQTADEGTRGRPFVKVAGVRGGIDQSVREAKLATNLGYDLALISPLPEQLESEEGLLERTRKVAEVTPVFAFYLQPAAGGRPLSHRFWTELLRNEGVAAVKVAPFNRYETVSVMEALARSGRADDVALYTGNDDSIISDLSMPYVTSVAGHNRTVRFVGGLLGQWAIWTRFAVRLLTRLKAVRRTIPSDLARLAGELTDANGAVFDSRNGFRGVISGTNEVLRRQGLMQNRITLDPAEDLSPSQSEEIDRVLDAHPSLHAEDDEFVARHLAKWLD